LVIVESGKQIGKLAVPSYEFDALEAAEEPSDLNAGR